MRSRRDNNSTLSRRETLDRGVARVSPATPRGRRAAHTYAVLRRASLFMQFRAYGLSRLDSERTLSISLRVAPLFHAWRQVPRFETM